MSSISTLYYELRRLYSQIKPKLGEHAKGARILASPPLVGPRVMFLAINPGDSPGFKSQRKCDRTWPKKNEYARCKWALARKVQAVFSKEFLEKHTVVANVNFFRSAEAKAWKLVPKEVRTKARKFSREGVHRLIEELKPQLIVAIGFEAFNSLKPTNKRVLEWRPDSGKRRLRLVSTGDRAGLPIVGVLHLTGRHRPPMSDPERATIGACLKKLLKELLLM